MVDDVLKECVTSRRKKLLQDVNELSETLLYVNQEETVDITKTHDGKDG